MTSPQQPPGGRDLHHGGPVSEQANLSHLTLGGDRRSISFSSSYRERPNRPEGASEGDLDMFALDSRVEVREPLYVLVAVNAGSVVDRREVVRRGGVGDGQTRSVIDSGRVQGNIPSGPSLGVSCICYSRLLYGARPADETRVLGQGVTNETAPCVTDESKRARSLGARHYCPSQGLWAESWQRSGAARASTASTSVIRTLGRKGIHDE